MFIIIFRGLYANFYKINRRIRTYRNNWHSLSNIFGPCTPRPIENSYRYAFTVYIFKPNIFLRKIIWLRCIHNWKLVWVNHVFSFNVILNVCKINGFFSRDWHNVLNCSYKNNDVHRDQLLCILEPYLRNVMAMPRIINNQSTSTLTMARDDEAQN